MGDLNPSRVDRRLLNERALAIHRRCTDELKAAVIRDSAKDIFRRRGDAAKTESLAEVFYKNEETKKISHIDSNVLAYFYELFYKLQVRVIPTNIIKYKNWETAIRMVGIINAYMSCSEVHAFQNFLNFAHWIHTEGHVQTGLELADLVTVLRRILRVSKKQPNSIALNQFLRFCILSAYEENFRRTLSARCPVPTV